MASPRGELLVRIGENIIPIFKKEVNPLELMFGFPGSIKPLLAKYLEALSFNRPNLRIMEVGAGTGSATEVILEVLGSRTTADLASIGRYHFTDLSGGFLERARKRFSKWSSLMEYDILDIERDPAAQGFQAESYDVVVATHVSSKLQFKTLFAYKINRYFMRLQTCREHWPTSDLFEA
ncbi:hypothetical protein Ptr86124_013843, partial [Pyrenophora tritici-repentis]